MKQVNFRLSDEDYNILKEKLPCTVPAYFAFAAKRILDKIKDENVNVVDNSMSNTKFLDVDYDDEYLNNVLRTCVTDSQKAALEAAAKNMDGAFQERLDSEFRRRSVIKWIFMITNCLSFVRQKFYK